jgi:hypothetical protein
LTVVAHTCSRCGTTAEGPDDGVPEGWSLATSDRGIERICRACTRDNIRSIEAKLPEEWWE